MTIGSCDEPDLEVVTHYNPKELDLAKQATWKDINEINQRTARRENDVLDLEYTGTPGRTLALELVFDCYEDKEVESIEPVITRLMKMASPRDESSTEPDMRRPHLCVVAWGDRDIGNFRCVIESIAVKYTMFSRAGRAVRATVQLKLKEAKLRRDTPRRPGR
ncbi:MAG TPA: hypothetical protein VK427_23605 [Kofleriaceae bacterium]|nr:hypothetical protein [Kofleriaceae bacterium]